MPKGMPKIKVRAHATLTLVLGHHLRFDPAASLYSEGQCFGIPVFQALHVLTQPRKKFSVADQSVLDHFRQPSSELSLRQACEGLKINNHVPRLMERTN